MDAPLDRTAVATLLIFFLSTRVIKATAAHVFALILSLVAIAFFNRESAGFKERYLTDMERKYDAIGAPANLHADARLVQFFFWLRDWRKLNPDAYDNAVDATDNLLKLEADVLLGTSRCGDQYAVALDLYRTAMNHLHAFVFSLSQPTEVLRLRNALSAIQKLLLSHLNIVSTACKTSETAEMTVNTQFLDSLRQPVPYDQTMTPGQSRFSVY